MYTNGVHCQSERLRPYLAQVAELRADGSVTICKTRNMRANNCDLGNAGERAATLAFGRRVTVGPFRCAMLRSGFRCVVIASGKGFLLTRTSLTGVGGAATRPAPLHLETFNSPDRHLWCGIVEGKSAFCDVASTANGGGFPSGSASLESTGKVELCFYATEAQAPVFGGIHRGCLQNWSDEQPVLAVGQTSEEGDVRCTSAANGITCVGISGATKGKGFRASSNGVAEVG